MSSKHGQPAALENSSIWICRPKRQRQDGDMIFQPDENDFTHANKMRMWLNDPAPTP